MEDSSTVCFTAAVPIKVLNSEHNIFFKNLFLFWISRFSLGEDCVSRALLCSATSGTDVLQFSSLSSKRKKAYSNFHFNFSFSFGATRNKLFCPFPVFLCFFFFAFIFDLKMLLTSRIRTWIVGAIRMTTRPLPQPFPVFCFLVQYCIIATSYRTPYNKSKVKILPFPFWASPHPYTQTAKHTNC